MNDMNTTTPGAPSTRPTLLTVICIISFIMGALSIISSIRTFTTDQSVAMAEAQSQMEEAKVQLGDQADGMAGKLLDSGMEIAQRTAENAVAISISGILLSLLSLIGVWMMWNLRKSGFWLYLISTVVGLIVPLYFIGGSMMAIMSIGFIGFFSLLFIILYAVNLKYMH